MSGRKFGTLREQLFWCYASMQMLMVARKRGLSEYDRSCYAIRKKYFYGYLEGRFFPTSLVRNTAARFSDRTACWYCGAPASVSGLTYDHVLPRSKRGPDSADNIFMVCRHCNSSKRDSDLMVWWFSTFEEPAPLYLWASYLKLVYQFALDDDLMDMPPEFLALLDLPFDARALLYEFPLNHFL